MKNEIDLEIESEEFEGTVLVEFDDENGEIFSVERYNSPRALDMPITSNIERLLTKSTMEYIQDTIDGNYLEMECE